jgi:branched-chain amino acid transport system ATP-binding protein
MNLETALRRKEDRPVTVAPEASLVDVAGLLAAERCEIVVACDGERNLLGVVTDTDVLRHVAACGRQECGCASRVADVMTRDVVTCRLDDDLRQVWNVMKESGHRRVPVVDSGGRLSGVVNVRDVFRFLLDEKELEKREILHFLDPQALRGEPMFEVLETLRKEHFRIGAVLTCLHHLVAGIGGGGRRPEPDLLRAMLDYMEGFANVIHHPKEEACLFAALRRRKPDEAGALDRMTEEHDTAAGRLSEVRTALLLFRDDGENAEILRSSVERYVRFERAHMHREESDFMPLAARYLAAEDWRRIRDAFARRDDPAFGTGKTEEYDRLFRSILDRVPDAPVFRIADG